MPKSAIFYVKKHIFSTLSFDTSATNQLFLSTKRHESPRKYDKLTLLNLNHHADYTSGYTARRLRRRLQFFSVFYAGRRFFFVTLPCQA